MVLIKKRKTRPAAALTFASLPIELRLMIWKNTFHRRRILHIDSNTTYLPLLPTGHKGRRKACPRPHHVSLKTTQPSPVALRVCRESRTLALRYYKPALHSWTYPESRASSQKQTAIYFNPDLDVVHIVDPHDRVRYQLSRKKETVREIRFLAIAKCLRVQEVIQMQYLWHDWRNFEKLEEMIFVVNEGQTAMARSVDVIKRDVEDNLTQFRNILQTHWQGDVQEVWRIPVVKVMEQQAFEEEYGE